MDAYNLEGVCRLRQIWREEIPPNSKVYLSMPGPMFKLAFLLWDLQEITDSKPADLDLRRNTYVHTTLLSPRVIPSRFPAYSIARIIDETPRFDVTLTEIEYFEDSGLLVGKFAESEPFKELHRRILSLDTIPKGDPTYEGDGYNPHVTLGKSTNPERDIPYLTTALELPLTWTAVRVEVNVKRPTDKLYQEACFYTFEGKP